MTFPFLHRLTGTACAAALIASLGVSSARACAFHTYTPDPTVVDMLLESEAIVLARPGASRSDGFHVVRSLQGPDVEGSIDVEVDFPTRGRLAANPNDALLLVRGYDYGPWTWMAYADPDYQTVLQKAVSHLPDWAVGDEEQRLQFFADLLGHASHEVYTLALKELDRADYGVLRSLDLAYAPDLTEIVDGDDALRPIRVLLAGLAATPGSAAVLSDALRENVEAGVPYLGAYIIALLELRGPAEAARIADTYLHDARLPVAIREKIVEAFAIQARTGDADLRAALREVTSDMLAARPELGPAVARQFGFQGDWSQAVALTAVAETHQFQDIADLFALNQYIAIARDAAASGQ